MRALLLVVILVACGSSPVAVAVAPPPPPSPPVVLAAPASVSCGDAGVLLRGKVDDAKNAPYKEQLIASSCLHDHWSADVLACIGRDKPRGCLDRLTDDQRATLDRDLAAWAELTGESVDDVHPKAEHRASCASALEDVAAYPPVVGLVGEEQEFAVALREAAIELLCNASWTDPTKRCFDAGRGPVDCGRLLSPGDRKALADKLAELDGVLATMAAAKKQPAATYDCKQLALAYYSDAAWAAKLPPSPKATKADVAERKKLIATARTRMSIACASEGWNATVRACIAGGAGDACFSALGLLPISWGFPPAGAIHRTGISECDAYATVNARLVDCKTMPKETRDGLRQSIDTQRHAWETAGEDDKPAFATACRAGTDALRQVAQGLGCTI